MVHNLCYLLISFACISSCCICPCSSDCYGSLYKYVYITTGDLVGSSQVLFEAAFVIFSAILFPTKSPVDINSIFGFNWISLYITLLLTTKIKFTLSSVFICIEFWPVNHTSVRKNSKGNLSVYIWFVGEIFSSWSNELSHTKVHKTIELCWYWLLT